jgi:hypothetical protein
MKLHPESWFLGRLNLNKAEVEYFFDPEKQKWEELFEDWKKEMWNFAQNAWVLRRKSCAGESMMIKKDHFIAKKPWIWNTISVWI